MSIPMSIDRSVAIQPMVYGASLLLLPLTLLLFFSSANQLLFHFLNERLVFWHGEVFWALLTNFGDGFFLFPVAMLLFWRCPQRQLAVILSILLLAIVIHLAKRTMGVPRPGAELDLHLMAIVGPLLKGDSMPSGHAATAFVLVGLGLLYLGRSFKMLLLLLMTLVAISRVAVGAHWPCDVICGAWVGLICASLGGWLSQRIKAGLTTRLVFVGLGMLAMIVLPGYDNGFQHYPAICLTQYLLASAAALVVIVELCSLYRDYHDNLKRHCHFLLHRYPVVDRLLRFAMVGTSGFIVDMAIYSLLSSVMGVSHLAARGGSYWCSASWNWFWNRTVTFPDAVARRKWIQWSQYLLMCAISFVPNWGTYYLLTSCFDFFDTCRPLALMMGVAAGMGFNFSIASMIIFVRRPVSAELEERTSDL